MPTRIADDLSQRKNGRINGPSLGHHLGKRQYGSSGGHNFGCSGGRRRAAIGHVAARTRGREIRCGPPVALGWIGQHAYIRRPDPRYRFTAVWLDASDFQRG
jgi:hypothetical protein